MTMDGIALGARFSIETNRLGFCGPAGMEPAMRAAILKGDGMPSVGRALLQFEALGPYLEAIAEKHGRSPLDHDVVEAYWIGNELLDAFERKDFISLLGALTGRGLPRRIADRLTQRLPEMPLPHHLFHVCFVGVGNVTGHVETVLPNMESCRPAWATVVSATDGVLTLRKPRLSQKDGYLSIGTDETVTVAYDPAFLPAVRQGSQVVLHWGWPAMELSSRQRINLERYSAESLAAYNETLMRKSS
jgi:hypothetical protein